MASKAVSVAALLLCVYLLFFTLASASSCAPSTPKKPSPKPALATPKPSPAKASCPKDTLKFGACADLLKGLVHVVVGAPLGGSSCCALISDLADAEAAVCLCTAIKANVLGVNLNASVSITALLNNCGKKVPKGFKCK